MFPQEPTFRFPFIYWYGDRVNLNAFSRRKVVPVALIGYVRVSTDEQDTQRQRDALEPLCARVFEEKISGTKKAVDRPQLSAALNQINDSNDMLVVQEIDRLGRNLFDGLMVLNELFERGVTVRVLDGIGAGDHSEGSLILHIAMALAEDRRKDISRKTRNGLEAARARGRVGGRPRVVDEDKRRIILSRRADGQSLREIASAVGVSVGVVHQTVNAAENEEVPA